MILYCPVCQKLIQDCTCGDGCAVCVKRKAIYALQVCGECVELPEDDSLDTVDVTPGKRDAYCGHIL
jgi:hypothetical protein